MIERDFLVLGAANVLILLLIVLTIHYALNDFERREKQRAELVFEALKTLCETQKSLIKLITGV